MITLSRTITAVSVLLSAILATAQTYTTGTTKGTFDVSSSGGASYSIDLAVPPGTNGAAPDLSLYYNSALGNGVAGVGWQINGLGTIGRIGATIAQDGYRGGVTYSPTDRFALNGLRIIAVSGVDGANNTQYRTEKESYSFIISHNDDTTNAPCGSGPCWFSLQKKDGSMYEFGRTADSRILASGRQDVRVWALNRFTDLNGNSVTFQYTAIPYSGATNEGAYYVDTIQYTQNTGAGLNANRSLKFTYEQRSDALPAYTAGSVVTMRGRLKTVTMLVQSQSVLEYRIAYESAPPSTTGKSRIASIAQCASSSAAAVCLSPTRFTWQNMGATYENAGTWQATDFVSGWDPVNNPRYVIDANGDGLADIVGFRNGVIVATSTGNNSFSAAGTWSTNFGPGWTSSTPRTLADVTGDGRADVIGFFFDNVQVAPSSGTSFDASLWTSSPYNYFGFNQGYTANNNPRLMADVNGDGRADIVGFGNQTNVGLSTGNSFQAPTIWNASSFTGGNWYEATGSLRKLADVNGDGRADVVGFGTSGVVVGISTGTSFDTTKWAQNATGYPNFNLDSGWSVSANPRSMADVNGDGLADIVGFRNGVQVALSTGNGFTAPMQWSTGFSPESSPPWPSAAQRYVVDANGDGRADVVGFNSTGATIAISTGSSFSGAGWTQSLPNYTGANPKYPIVVGDVNGDAMIDVVSFGAVTGVNVRNVMTGLADPPYPDLLTRIADGLGDVYDITYAPMTSPAVYSANVPSSVTQPLATALLDLPVAFDYSAVAATYPVRVLNNPRAYLAASYVRRNDPAKNAYPYSDSTSLFYTNLQFDVLAQRTLGFATTAKIGTNRTTSTTFNQTYPLQGTPLFKYQQCGTASSDPQCAPGKTLSATATTYTSRQTATGSTGNKPPVYAVDQTRAAKNVYYYGTWDYATATTYAYDNYSNVTLQSWLGYVDQQGGDISATDNLYTGTSYQNTVTPTGWTLGYPLEQKQSLNATSALNFSSFTDGTDLTLMQNKYDSRMNVYEGWQWDDQNDVYLKTAYGYDPVGNQNASTTPFNARTTTTYDTTYRTYVDTQTLPADAQGTVMTISYGYDPATGKQIATADANGNVTIEAFDAFSRPTLRQGPKPDLPNVVSDPNGVSPNVTGSFNFKNAVVVTLWQGSWNSDTSGGIYQQRTKLQNWPTASSRDTRWEKRYVDGRGRMFQTVQQTDSPNGNAFVCRQRTGDGRIKRRSLTAFTKSSAPICAVNTPSLFWVDYTYDAYRRKQKIVMPAGATGTETAITQYAYSPGEVAVKTEAAGDPYQYVTQLTRRIVNGKPRTKSLAVRTDGNATSTFQWDNLGRLLSATDPATTFNPSGVTLSYQWDSLGRQIRAASPDFGYSNVTYAPTGQIASQTTPRGTTTFVLDALNRILTATFPDRVVAGYSYDSSSVTNGRNRLTGTSVTLPNGSQESSWVIGYDKYGNRASQQLTLAGESGPFTVATTNDPLGRPLVTTFPDGSTYQRVYGFGSLRSQTIGAASVTYSNFTADGAPQTIAYGNGTTIAATFTVQGQPYTLQATANGTSLLGFTYQWNHLFELVSATDTAGTYGSSTFGYTSRRATSSTGPSGPSTFGYDQSGNLTSANGTTYTYTAHRVVTGTAGGQNVFSAEYDSVGNMKTVTEGTTTRTLTWDGRNALTSVVDGSGTTTFSYDVDNQRLRKIEPDGTRTVYVTPSYRIVTRPQQSPVVTRIPDVLPVLRPFQVTGDASQASSALYLLQDHVGSTIQSIDSANRPVTKIVYDPYGRILSLTGPDGVVPKYQGKEWDANAALYYFDARYQNPRVGRFTIPDDQIRGKVQQDALNLYSFGANNPVNYVDTDGHMYQPAHPPFALFEPQLIRAQAEEANDAADAAQIEYEDASAQFDYIMDLLDIAGDAVDTIQAAIPAAGSIDAMVPTAGDAAQQLLAQIDQAADEALNAANAAADATTAAETAAETAEAATTLAEATEASAAAAEALTAAEEAAAAATAAADAATEAVTALVALLGLL